MVCDEEFASRAFWESEEKRTCKEAGYKEDTRIARIARVASCTGTEGNMQGRSEGQDEEGRMQMRLAAQAQGLGGPLANAAASGSQEVHIQGLKELGMSLQMSVHRKT